MAHRYNLDQHTRLAHSALKAEWQSEINTWLVTIRDERNKKVFQRRSRIVISAVGALSIPKSCDVPGHEDFKGRIFHSATWDHSFDHAGKDVIVLGMSEIRTRRITVLKSTQVTDVVPRNSSPSWQRQPKASPSLLGNHTGCLSGQTPNTLLPFDF